MYSPINSIFSPYFRMNGPEQGHFLAIRKNSDIFFLYIAQMDGCHRNNGLFCPYVCLGSSSGETLVPPLRKSANRITVYAFLRFLW
ncbi:hypothetical protein PAMA110636_25145 [Paenibacillus macerans]